ncbi:uncharacterized protein LOC101236456 isoform X2 [Hydra vulgaris]|uniref:Uncharacterized protein LOC101236456 isoform X2 n=1 Tax=Hydra vulgaris TaxID=6087 RepID=A0ABM4CX23_HYDVU
MSTKIWEQIKLIDVTCANILKNFDLCKDEDLKWICFEDLKTTIFPGESGKVIVQRGKVWKIISANKVPIALSSSCISVDEPANLKELFQEDMAKDKDYVPEVLSEEEVMQDTRKDASEESCEEEVREIKIEYDLEESSKEKKKRRKRFCIFCKRQYAALSRHIKQKHKDEPRLKHLNNESMKKELELIRREGIIAVNREEAKKAIPVYQAERRSKFDFKNNIEEQDLTTCPNCLITLKKKQFSRHKRRCQFLS